MGWAWRITNKPGGGGFGILGRILVYLREV